MSNFLTSLKWIRTLVLVSTVLAMMPSSQAQLDRASPPVADPADHRFKDVQEDWTTPSLTTSSLLPVSPLHGFVDDKPQYTVELLRLQWRWGDPIDVYVMKPKSVKKPPVILYLYGYPTDTDLFMKDEYEDLVTKNGVAAVGFVSALTAQRYHDRPMKEWFLSELQQSLSTSAHDVQMVLNYLATRGDLDMDSVGMFAQGSGASIAILASAVDPRIKVLELMDPWGDWPTWIATSPFPPTGERPDYVKPEFLKKVSTLDPVDWLPKMQAKKVRLDDQLYDAVTPPACRDKLRAAFPAGTTVELYKTFDEFKAAFKDGKNLEWIQHKLQSLPGQASAASTTATH